MGAAAEKLDDVTAGTADPAIVVDLEEHRRRRSRRTSRTASAISALLYDSASEPGLYRYSAFGKTVEDTATSNFDQPLRWKGRWFSNVAGGIYDVRARQWSPELGAFLAVDEFEFHDNKGTLWSWPRQNPVRLSDHFGRGEQCIYQPPDECRRDPTSKECRWARCPKSTIQSCLDKTEDAFHRCVEAEQAKGASFNKALETCGSAKDKNLDICLDAFCPP